MIKTALSGCLHGSATRVLTPEQVTSMRICSAQRLSAMFSALLTSNLIARQTLLLSSPEYPRWFVLTMKLAYVKQASLISNFKDGVALPKDGHLARVGKSVTAVHHHAAPSPMSSSTTLISIRRTTLRLNRRFTTRAALTKCL